MFTRGYTSGMMFSMIPSYGWWSICSIRHLRTGVRSELGCRPWSLGEGWMIRVGTMGIDMGRSYVFNGNTMGYKYICVCVFYSKATRFDIFCSLISSGKGIQDGSSSKHGSAPQQRRKFINLNIGMHQRKERERETQRSIDRTNLARNMFFPSEFLVNLGQVWLLPSSMLA